MLRFKPFESLENRTLFTIAFAAPVAFQVDANTTGVLQAPIAADFNKDGKVDLLVVDATSDANVPGKLAFAAGNGNGTFTVGASFSGGIFNGPGKAGDINGDGNLDVVLPNGFGQNVVVLLGNGDGTFGAPSSFTVGQEPLALTIGDFNGDSFNDIAVGNRTDNSVTIRLGSNQSILQQSQTITGFNDPASIVAGDFNGDGSTDLVVGNAGGTDGVISFLANNGSGTFSQPLNTTGPRGATGVGDFNADGKLDLAISVSDTGVATLALGQGNGTFTVNSAPAGGFIALVGDYDGDGKADIASAGTSDNKVRVLQGRGDGSFDTFQAFSADAPGAGTVADVNGDTKPDLILTGLTSNGRVIDTLINNSTPGGGTGGGVVDLTGTLSLKLPAAVVAGTSGKASVKVINAGPGLLNGPVTVTLFASPDGSVANGTPLAAQTKTLKLKARKSKTLKFKFTYSAALPDGNYTIVAQVDSANAVAETNESNNLAATATQVNIAAPFVDLSGAFTRGVPASAAVGSKQTFQVAVTNSGNVAAKGPLQITFNATPTADGSGGTLIGTLNTKISLKPGATKVLKFKAVLPAGVTAGSYFIAANLDTANAFVEKLETNNLAVSATQMIVS